MTGFGTRRARLWGFAVLGLLGVATGWFVWLPGVVRTAVLSRLTARGFVAEVESVDLALNGVVLRQLRARSREPGLTVTATRVALEVLPWRGWGPDAVRTVDIGGLKVALTVDAPFTRSLFTREGRPAPMAGNKVEARALPALRMESVEITLADTAGQLVHARGVSVRSQASGWSVQGADVEIGASPGEVATLKGARAAGAWVGRRPVLSAAGASSALLQWAGDAAEGAPVDAFPSADGRTVARLRASVAALRGAGERSAATQDKNNEAAHALWEPDAKLTLADARVVRGTGSEAVEILGGLSVTLQAEPEEAVRLQVSGQDGGRIGLDVRVWPRAARVEGSVELEDVSLALFAPALPPLPFFEIERTRVRARLSLKAQGLEAIAAAGEVEIRDLAFASEGLSRLPVGPVSFLARGDGTWTPARRELNVAHADLEIGALRAQANGALAWPTGGYRVDGSVQLSKAPCQQVLQAVPVALLDELSAVELEGDFAAKLLVHVDAADLDATKVDFKVEDGCRFAAVPPILDLTRFMQPFMHRVLEPEGEIFEFETGPGTPAWTPIELVSPFMVQAAVAHEDGRFFTHHGFAEPEIAVALARNLKARAFRFGASTITMQLVKNVFLHRDKLLSRKVQEAFITWWLEQQWDKRHILELYLNVIEYGPELYGIRNAAWHYFGTIPMNLTPAQSAFLASILPSPKSMHSYYDAGELSASMKGRMASFLKHMRARERIDEEALQFGLEELTHFSFYRPDQPPPVAPVIRGTAQNPPFDLEPAGIDAWDTFDVPADGPVEDGSFGTTN